MKVTVHAADTSFESRADTLPGMVENEPLAARSKRVCECATCTSSPYVSLVD
jgi:hypothetical protein